MLYGNYDVGGSSLATTTRKLDPNNMFDLFLIQPTSVNGA
jgi:hypothetical protein